VDAAFAQGANSDTGPQSTIYVKPGRYNENVTIYDGINLISLVAPSQSPYGNIYGLAEADPVVTLNGLLTANMTTGPNTSTNGYKCSVSGFNLLPTGSVASDSIINVMGDASRGGADSFWLNNCVTTYPTATVRARNGVQMSNAIVNLDQCGFYADGSLVGNTGDVSGSELVANDSYLVAQGTTNISVGGGVAIAFDKCIVEVSFSGTDLTVVCYNSNISSADPGYPFGTVTTNPGNCYFEFYKCNFGEFSVPFIDCTVDPSTHIIVSECQCDNDDSFNLPAGLFYFINSSTINGNSIYDNAQYEVSRLITQSSTNQFSQFRRLTRQDALSTTTIGPPVSLADISVPTGIQMTISSVINGADHNHTDVTAGKLLAVVDGTLGIIGNVQTDVFAGPIGGGTFTGAYANNTFSILVQPPFALTIDPYNWGATTEVHSLATEL
jgi:hypothetical protein